MFDRYDITSVRDLAETARKLNASRGHATAQSEVSSPKPNDLGLTKVGGKAASREPRLTVEVQPNQER